MGSLVASVMEQSDQVQDSDVKNPLLGPSEEKNSNQRCLYGKHPSEHVRFLPVPVKVTCAEQYKSHGLSRER